VQVLSADPGKPTRRWRERIGLVLQECELDPSLTVRETLSLYASFYPAPRPVTDNPSGDGGARADPGHRHRGTGALGARRRPPCSPRCSRR
jgi:hypothetical protein